MTDFHSIGLKLDANGVAIGVDQVTKSITDLGIAEDKTAESTRRFSDAQSKQTAVIQTAAQQAIALATSTQQKITDIAETAIAKNMALQKESFDKILAMQIKAIADRDAIIRKAEAEVISIKETAIQKHMDLQVKANEKLAELGRKDKEEKIAIQNKLQQDIDKLQIAAIAKYESIINTSQTRILAISEAANVKRIAEETKLQNKIDKLQVDAISNRDAALIKSSASEVQITESKSAKIAAAEEKNAAYLQKIKNQSALMAGKESNDVYTQFNVKSYEDRVVGVKALTEELNRLKSMHVSGGVEALAHSQTIKSLEGEINKMTLGVFNARGEFHQMLSKMALLVSEITRVIFGVTAMAAAFAAPAIIGGKYLKDMEDLKLGISGVVLAMGTIDGKTLTWGQASQVADEQMKKLQNTAMSMAGTTQDLSKAFQAVATQGLEAGMSIDQIRTIAIAGVAAGRALGISATTLQRDIRDMVLGIRPNSTILSASLGITKADIDAARASAGGLFEYLDGKLKGFIVASAQYNKTFTGMFEQMSEMFSRALSESSQDIFKGAKESMIGIMDMIGSINKKTGEFTVNPEFKMALDIILVSLNAMLILIVDVVKSIGFIAEGWMKLAILVKDFHFGDLPSVPSTLKEVNSELEKTKKLYASGFTLGLTNGTQDTQQLSLYITELEKAKIVLEGVAKVQISDNVTALAGKMNELHAAMKASGGAFLQADEAEKKLLHTHEAYNFALTEMAKLEKQYAAAKADTNTKSSDLKDMEKRLSDVRDTTKAVSESIKWEDALSAAHTRTLSATTDRARKLAEIDEKAVKEHASYAGALAAASSLAENLKASGSGATDKNIQEATKEVTRLKSLDLAVDKQRALALADLSEKELAPAKKLIESLKEKTAAQEIDLMVVGKQTELQKESAKWHEQVSNGTYKGTEAQKIETAALYEGLLTREQANIAMEKQVEEMKKINAHGITQIDTLDKQIAAQKLHNASIGMNAEQIAIEKTKAEELLIVKMEIEARDLSGTATSDAVAATKLANLEAEIVKAKELRNLKAAAAPLEAADAIAKRESEAQKKLWHDIDRFAHTAFNNITQKGKNAFAEIGKAIKESILDMLYKMTIQRWIFQISGVASLGGASGLAGATDMTGGAGAAGGGMSLIQSGQMLWSGFAGGMTSGIGSIVTGAGNLFGSAALQGLGAGITSPALGAGLGGSVGMGSMIGTAMPFIAAIAVALKVISENSGGGFIGSLFGHGFTSASTIGSVSNTYGQSGNVVSSNANQAVYNTNYPNQGEFNTILNGINTGYQEVTKQLGITAGILQTSLTGNTGREGQNPNFTLSGGVIGGTQFTTQTTNPGLYGSTEVPLTAADLQREASRVILTAIQGSKLPEYLHMVFDGLTAGSMTQTEINNVIAFGVALKDMSSILTAAGMPMEDFTGAVKGFNVTGETMAQTATRLGSEFMLTSRITEMLGGDVTKAFGGVGASSLKMRDDMVALMGGVQKAAVAVDAYYKFTHTAAQQHADATADVTKSFKDLGFELPKSAAEYEKLVKKIGTATPETATLTAKLILLAPAFASVTDSAEQAAQKAKDLAAMMKGINYDIATSGMTAYQKSIYDIGIAENDAITTATALGASEADLSGIRIYYGKKTLDTITAAYVGFDAAGLGKMMLDAAFNPQAGMTAAESFSDALGKSIKKALLTSTIEIISKSIFDSVITPMVTGAIAGQVVSAAASAGIIQDAKNRLTALDALFKSPEFNAFITTLSTTLAPIISQISTFGSSYSGSSYSGSSYSGSSGTSAATTAAKLLNDTLSLQAQIYALTGDKVAAAIVLEQQRAIALAALFPSLRDLQTQLWALQDAAKVAADALKLQNDTLSLQAQIYALTSAAALASGDAAAYAASKAMEATIREQQRTAALAALNVQDPTGALAGLTAQLWALQDAAKVAADALKLQNDTLSLQAQIYALTGDKAAAAAVLELQRAAALAVLNAQDPTGTLAGLTAQLWALQDAAKIAADALKLQNDTLSLQAQIYALTGDAAAAATVLQQQHVVALKALDPALRGLQTTLWGLEAAAKVESSRQSIASAFDAFVTKAKSTADAVKAAQEAITSGYVTAQDRVATAQKAISDISAQAAVAMKGFSDNIGKFLLQMKTTDLGGSSKTDQFSALLANFTTLTAQAKSGDTKALGDITNSAQLLLDSKKASATSALEYARFANGIANTLSEVATIADGKAGPLAVAVDPMVKALDELNRAQIDLTKWEKAISISGASTVKAVVDYAAAWVTANDANVKAQNDLLDATNATQGIDLSMLTELQKLNALIATWKVNVGGVGATPTHATFSSTGYENIKAMTSNQQIYDAVVKNNWDVYAVGAAFGNTVATVDQWFIDNGIQRLPGFAVGTNEVPYDMTANIHAGETITPKPFVDKQKAANDETRQINSDMRSELTTMRLELVKIRQTNEKIWQIEDKQDNEGIPSTRLAA